MSNLGIKYFNHFKSFETYFGEGGWGDVATGKRKAAANSGNYTGGGPVPCFLLGPHDSGWSVQLMGAS